MGHAGVWWGCSGSYSGGVSQGRVGHAGMQWDGSRWGHPGVCGMGQGVVGWVMEGWGGLCMGWVDVIGHAGVG